MAAGADLKYAAVLANHAAGIVVGKTGTATATIEEIESLFEKEESKIKKLDEAPAPRPLLRPGETPPFRPLHQWETLS